MENQPKPALVVKPDEGKGIAVVGDSYRVIISGRQTDNAYAVIEMLVPPGGGPGPHSHAGVDETFYLIDGELEFKTEDGTYIAGKGAFVEIPLGGLVHSFKNKSDKVAHMICTVTPAGMDEFFTELGEPSEFGKFLPPPPMTEDLKKKAGTLAEKYGQKLFPPDYLG